MAAAVGAEAALEPQGTSEFGLGIISEVGGEPGTQGDGRRGSLDPPPAAGDGDGWDGSRVTPLLAPHTPLPITAPPNHG